MPSPTGAGPLKRGGPSEALLVGVAGSGPIILTKLGADEVAGKGQKGGPGEGPGWETAGCSSGGIGTLVGAMCPGAGALETAGAWGGMLGPTGAAPLLNPPKPPLPATIEGPNIWKSPAVSLSFSLGRPMASFSMKSVDPRNSTCNGTGSRKITQAQPRLMSTPLAGHRYPEKLQRLCGLWTQRERLLRATSAAGYG